MKHNKISITLVCLLGFGSLAALGTALVTPTTNRTLPVYADANSYYEGINENVEPSSLLSSLKTLVNKNYHSLGYDGLLSAYHTTDKRADGYLNDYYSNITNFVIGGPAENRAYSKEGDGYNREHSIPKSWWGGSKTNQGCDAFIVWPTDGYVNNRRGNLSFGEVDPNNITYASKNNFSLMGASKLSGISAKVFEPADKWKGDFARMYFYAICKWPTTGWQADGGNTNFLTNLNAPNYGLTDYALSLFTKWHAQDPVDDWEIARNDHVQALQNNRNPFIDHPEWVTKIWGGEYISKNVTNLTYTGQVTKTTYSEGQTFDPTGLVVTATFEDNSTADVTSAITWNPSILSAGTTSVVGTYKGHDITINGLTVNPATIVNISVVEANTTLPLNGVFSFEGLINANLDNGLTKDITSNCTFSGYDLTTEGKQTVTVTYGTYTTSYEITVKEILAGEGYKIEFTDSNSDGSTVLDERGITALIKEGGNYISSLSNISKVYAGRIGLKMGSGSGAGTLTINLNNEGKQEIKGLKIYAAKFGSDASKITVTTNLNTSGEQIVLLSDVTAFDVKLDGKITTIGLTTEKRVYLSAIEVIADNSPVVITKVTGVSLDQETATVNKGDNLTLTATVAPENATNKNVSWSSSNDRVATVNNGVVTGIASGEATITVTTQDGNFQKTCRVTVESHDINVTGVTLNTNEIKGKIGETFTLTATVNPSNATNKAVTWSSTNNQVATVNNGQITLVGVGQTTITVKTVDGNFTATCEVIVEQEKQNEQPTGGCGGSVITGSILITSISLVALSLLTIKKIKFKA